MSCGPILVGIVVTSEMAGRVLGHLDLRVPGHVVPDGEREDVRVELARPGPPPRSSRCREDRNAPTGTSERMCMRTLSRSVSWIRRYSASGLVGRGGRNLGPVVAPGADLAAGGEGEALARPDPADAVVQGVRLRHVLQGQVVRQVGRVQPGVALGRRRRERQQGLLLAGEVHAVRSSQVVQRLDAERIAGAERLALVRCPRSGRRTCRAAGPAPPRPSSGSRPRPPRRRPGWRTSAPNSSTSSWRSSM